MNRVVDITRKMVWGLAVVSSASCLIRNDFNVVFAFFFLLVLNNFFNSNTRLFTKIILQINAVLTLMDIVWFFVMQSVWSNRPENDYWKSLAGLQTLALVLCWVEIAIKLLIFFYLFVDYKDKNPEDVNDLLTLNYSKAKTRQENRGATASHDDEFRNPYAN